MPIESRLLKSMSMQKRLNEMTKDRKSSNDGNYLLVEKSINSLFN